MSFFNQWAIWGLGLGNVLPANWILSGGSWHDGGFWVDSASWEDS